MNYRAVEKNGKIYVEGLVDDGLLDSENAALDLVAACGEYRCDCLLLPFGALPEDFFQLKTGLAGRILLKFSNYRIHVAAVIDPDRARDGRFGEMVMESNQGNAFRVFEDHSQAEAWLFSL